MRTLLVAVVLLCFTPVLGTVVIVAGLLRIPDRRGGIYDRVKKAWAGSLCRAAGVQPRLHHAERIVRDGAAVYVANHVSWFDIFVLAWILPRYTFVAKAELEKIPLFGAACRAAGIIFIERANRRSAFDSYKAAAADVRGGRSVVVCPEGTRGRDYHLRPFKKGPFVFAISSGAPIVPVVLHGTIRIQPKGTFRVRSGVVDVHFLEPVPTAGHDYEQRAELMSVVWERMAGTLRSEYGIATSEYPVAGEGERPEQQSSFF